MIDIIINRVRTSRLSSALVVLILGAIINACIPQIGNSNKSADPQSASLIYDENLASAWQDWSWDITRDLGSTTMSQSGCSSVSIQVNKPWGSFYLHRTSPLETRGYTHLEFFVNGGSSGSQKIKISVNGDQKNFYQFSAPANAWAHVSIPLSKLGSPDSLVDLYWQDAVGEVQPEFFLDAITLVDQNKPVLVDFSGACENENASQPAEANSPATNSQASNTPAPNTGSEVAAAPTEAAQPVSSGSTPVIIYDDTLAVGWQNWSWDVDSDPINPTPTKSGPTSIAVVIKKAWGSLYLHSDAPVSTEGYTHLDFYVHGGAAGKQKINLNINGNQEQMFSVIPIAGKWDYISIPLSEIGSPVNLIDLYWQDASGGEQPVFYLDSISLVDYSETTLGSEATRAASTEIVAGTRFVTLPPGSTLPDEAECAAAIREMPENKGGNELYNATTGGQGIAPGFFGSSVDQRANSQIAVRVNGDFTGTTDEILQWAACKWGIDEDIVRAQAAVESWWQQDAKGDWTSQAANCAPGHGLGVDGRAGECPESFGILQNRYPYEQSAWPAIYDSTAFNADTAYGIWRACYEGYEWWLNTTDRGKEYEAGDIWGCVGRWFAGRWHTQPAEEYTQRVKDYLSSRVWETPDFQEP